MSATRILIADDDQEILTITSRSLQSQGYLTFECRNGIDAYQAIVSQPFDLILLDINMEGLDGFRIIQKVREQQIFTPILIITGNAEEYNEVFGLSTRSRRLYHQTVPPFRTVRKSKSTAAPPAAIPKRQCDPEGRPLSDGQRELFLL